VTGTIPYPSITRNLGQELASARSLPRIVLRALRAFLAAALADPDERKKEPLRWFMLIVSDSSGGLSDLVMMECNEVARWSAAPCDGSLPPDELPVHCRCESCDRSARMQHGPAESVGRMMRPGSQLPQLPEAFVARAY
jgi:hypothetical protein